MVRELCLNNHQHVLHVVYSVSYGLHVQCTCTLYVQRELKQYMYTCMQYCKGQSIFMIRSFNDKDNYLKLRDYSTDSYYRLYKRLITLSYQPLNHVHVTITFNVQ